MHFIPFADAQAEVPGQQGSLPLSLYLQSQQRLHSADDRWR